MFQFSTLMETFRKKIKKKWYFQVPLAICGTIGVFTATNYIYDKVTRKYKEYPPGPTGLPILGSAISAGIDQRKFFDSLGDKSPISLIYIGRQPVVLLNDPKIILHLFKHNSHNFDAIINDRMPVNHVVSVKDWDPFANLRYHPWLPRRKLVRNALPKVLNSKYLDKIVSSIFYQRLIKRIKDETENYNKSWKSMNVDFERFQFYLLFESIFGSKIMNSKDCKDDDKKYDGDDDVDVDVFKDGDILDKYFEVVRSHVQESMNIGYEYTVYNMFGIDPFVWLTKYWSGKVEHLFLGDLRKMMIETIDKYTKYSVEELDNLRGNPNDVQDSKDVFILDTLIQAMKNVDKC